VPNSSSLSSLSSSFSNVLLGNTLGVPIILDGEELVENLNCSPLGSTQLDVTKIVSIISTYSKCGIPKEFLQAILKLVWPCLIKNNSLLGNFLNGKAIN